MDRNHGVVWNRPGRRSDCWDSGNPDGSRGPVRSTNRRDRNRRRGRNKGTGRTTRDRIHRNMGNPNMARIQTRRLAHSRTTGNRSGRRSDCHKNLGSLVRRGSH
jgi:hypothetical protein